MRRRTRLGRLAVLAALLAAVFLAGCSRDVLPSYWITQKAPEKVSPAAPEAGELAR